MQFHVLIPVHNRVDQTERVLECLALQTRPGVFVYLIDDGSTDGTSVRAVRLCQGRLNLRIIYGDGTLWWAGAIRAGMAAALNRCAGDDVVVLMNNDIVFNPNFLHVAASVLATRRDAIVGPLVVDERDRLTLTLSGSVMKCWPVGLTYRPYEGFQLGDQAIAPLTAVDFIGGHATFIPADVIRRVGFVASDQLPHYHADGEYSYRAKRAGVQVFVSADLVVYHSTETTGTLNSFRHRASLGALLKSPFDVRSPNHLRSRLMFGRLCCPPVWLPMFLVSDTLRMMLRTGGFICFGSRVRRWRVWANALIRIWNTRRTSAVGVDKHYH